MLPTTSLEDGLLLKARSRFEVACMIRPTMNADLRRYEDPGPFLHSIETGIKRAFVHLQPLAGELQQAAADTVTMHRARGQDAEDQKVEGALEKTELVVRAILLRHSKGRVRQ